MYWFDAIATRNFPYVIRHQNAARGDLAKQMKSGFYIFQENQDSLLYPSWDFAINIHLLYTQLQLNFDIYLGKYQRRKS